MLGWHYLHILKKQNVSNGWSLFGVSPHESSRLGLISLLSHGAVSQKNKIKMWVTKLTFILDCNKSCFLFFCDSDILCAFSWNKGRLSTCFAYYLHVRSNYQFFQWTSDSSFRISRVFDIFCVCFFHHQLSSCCWRFSSDWLWIVFIFFPRGGPFKSTWMM